MIILIALLVLILGSVLILCTSILCSMVDELRQIRLALESRRTSAEDLVARDIAQQITAREIHAAHADLAARDPHWDVDCE